MTGRSLERILNHGLNGLRAAPLHLRALPPVPLNFHRWEVWVVTRGAGKSTYYGKIEDIVYPSVYGHPPR